MDNICCILLITTDSSVNKQKNKKQNCGWNQGSYNGSKWYMLKCQCLASIARRLKCYTCSIIDTILQTACAKLLSINSTCHVMTLTL